MEQIVKCAECGNEITDFKLQDGVGMILAKDLIEAVPEGEANCWPCEIDADPT